MKYKVIYFTNCENGFYNLKNMEKIVSISAIVTFNKTKRIIMKIYSKKYLIDFIISHLNICKTFFLDQPIIQLLKNLYLFETTFLS